ncbi:putative cysteine-rich receptor-like protein kinase 31 [Lolium rigidum]|uniref:putative cysteine-rich receptor-like protein kinase 31 n=1 Tax=Lolium rigidum TaxID=89674 RepID=UPI001F5D3DB0|nr:putative cysteine-rich receptor-like protein kinase 31 [Lolium rigidum]
MAQWDNLGCAASVAQLAGVDALGLISTILQAAQAVRHNRETCQELVQDLQMMEDLLKLLKEPEMMRQDEIKNVLNGLDTTRAQGGRQQPRPVLPGLRRRVPRASSWGGIKQSDQFRRVKKKIAKHLRFYPMISHADITRRLEELGRSVQSSSSSQQDSQELRTSSTSSQNPETRSLVGTPSVMETEPVEIETEPAEIEMTQARTESTIVEEHQQSGSNEKNGSLPTKKRRFVLKLPLSGKKWSTFARGKGKVETPPFIAELTGPGFTFFHFTQLSAATNNFASEYKIEGWGSDDVYKGRLPNGLEIMIKRKPHPNTSEPLIRLKDEIRFLAKLQHMNIVKLVGCCTERGEALLAYEYMANGRLTDIISVGTGTKRFLDWSKRFKIIIGIARGLLYLHECCGMHIIHGDLSPRSILLDSNMAPKITDFACSNNYRPDEHRGSLHGTMGYMDANNHRVYSVRSDIFSFGMTLLEIITAQSTRELQNNENYDPLRLWTMERTAQLIDPALHGEPRMAEIMRCIQVALLCTGSDGKDPLSMWDVLLMLSCESAVIPTVPTPRGENPQITQHPEASGSGWGYHDEGELSDSDIVDARW